MKKNYIKLLFCFSLFTSGIYAQTWNNQYNEPTLEFNKLLFLDQNVGWAFADSAFNGTFISGNLYHTTNHGAVWNRMDMGANNYRIFAASLVGAQHIFAGGRDANFGGNTGLFVKSNNGGVTWTNAYNFNERISGICFIDTLTGWVMGKNSLLYKTTDGGVSWNAVIINSGEDFMDMKFLNNMIGMMVCSGGEIYRTVDGGLNWTFVNSGSGEDFEHLAAVAANQFWVCGSAGTIMKSNDAGLTWLLQNSTTVNDLVDISFANPNYGIAVGLAGEFLITNDGGATWIPQTALTTIDLSSVFAVDADASWFCSIEGEIFGLETLTANASLVDKSENIAVYPNPSNDLVNIKVFSEEQISHLSCV